MNNVRIMFLRDHNWHPVGCLAIKLDRSKGRVEYQVSVLNPQDRFNRAVGRQLAIGRLIENPLTVKVGKDASMHDISKAVLKDLKTQKNVLPSRAVKAANMWLAYNDIFVSSRSPDPFDP